MIQAIQHIESVSFNGWSGIVTLVILLGYMYSLGVSGRQYIKKVSTLGKQRMRMVNYTDEIVNKRADLILAVSVILSISIGAYFYISRLGLVSFGFLNYLITIGITAVILGVEYGIGSLIGKIFHISIYVADMKMRFLLVIIGMLSLLLSVISAIESSMVFSNILLALIIVSGLVLEIVIFVQNFFTKNDSLFYIFLYLCAAEILPFLVGFRLLNGVLN